MKRGNDGRTLGFVSLSQGGYTILETMIFLVVTGALLISAFGFLNGQQSRTQFNQSLRELDTDIRGALNEVESGYFDNRGGFVCTATSGNLSITTGNNAQGTNQDCVFMGKVMQFGLGSNNCTEGDTSGCSQYSLHTVVGLRRVGSGITAPTSFGAAQLTPIMQTALSNDSPDYSQTLNIPGNLRVRRVYEVRGAAVTDIGAFGFLHNLQSGGDPVSGTKGISLVSVSSAKLGNDKEAMYTAITNIENEDRNPDQIVVCLDEGGSGGRTSGIIIGGSSQELTTEVIVDVLGESAPARGGGCHE